MNFVARSAIRVSSKVRVSTTTASSSFSKLPASFASFNNSAPSTCSSSPSSTKIASFSTKASSIINISNTKNTQSLFTLECLLTSDDDDGV